MSDWFSELFGFREGSYDWTQKQFDLHGGRLCSKHTPRTFVPGSFSTPTVAELRSRAPTAQENSSVLHVVIEDVLDLHADPKNAGDMFQVASQFNALEFGSPEMTPEDGITCYADDMTQGPACALAAAAGTVFRNYLVDTERQRGQTKKSQINNLVSLESILSGGPYWQVKNGYVDSEEARLNQLAVELTNHRRDDLTGAIRVGIQEQTQVTFSSRFEILEAGHFVSQTFCSAIPCAYSNVNRPHWEALATIVLEAAYEGTLLAAAIEKARGTGSGRVWLTFLGGGVFGNDENWIRSAIVTAIERTEQLGLDIRVCHFQKLQLPYKNIGI